jgi:amino acid adenylation domain-containing protein
MTAFGVGPANSCADGVAPLSFAQQRLWLLDQLEPAPWAYNVAVARHLHGALDVDALRRALDEIVARHEPLRTTFTTCDGAPVQVVGSACPFDLEEVDAPSVDATELVTEFTRRHFDLELGPVFRGLLVRVAPDEHVLALSMHHIATDAWSESVLLDELSRCYDAFVRGAPSPLAPLPIRYRDFACAQRERLAGTTFDRHLDYWRAQLDGLPPSIELPTDRPRPARRTGRGASITIDLGASRTDALRRVAVAGRATLFMTLLAAFQALLARCANVDDLAVGTAIANRPRVETEPLIGFFANTLVLRADLTGDPTFGEFLRRVRAVALGAYEHQDVPFERLVKELHTHRTLGQTALFQHMFVFQNTPGRDLALDGVTTRPFPVAVDTAMFDLTLTLFDTGDAVTGTLEYATDLFDAPTARRLVGRFERLLDAIVAEPEGRISEYDLLDPTERDLLVRQWNDTAADHPDRCVHEVFEARASEQPDAVAVTAGSVSHTYRELDEDANRLAAHLRSLGVGGESPVGICLPRSYDAIVALLATLKAGGAYVPLDPEYPTARVAWMIDDAGVEVVVATTAARVRLGDRIANVVCLDDPATAATIVSLPSHREASSARADALAYVMYTSGSTGTPKGVLVEHRAIVSLLFGTDFVDFDDVGALLHMAPLAFDASTFEIWGALLHGARCVVDTGPHFSIEHFGALLAREHVDTLWLTAALFNVVVDEGWQHLHGVRQLITGGEALSPVHVARARTRAPHVRLVNGYGPTEATTFAACHDITAHGAGSGSVPIGRPIANTQLYVLDAHRQPVPIGVTGELYIGGTGLARGYVGDPQLTAERFVPNPFVVDGPAGCSDRVYRTGDLARARADGTLEFVGRVDDQVKIRGFRVEPGEVEAALCEHPRVGSCAVVACVHDAHRRLVAYVVGSPHDAPPAPAELREHLDARLPAHLVPAGFVALDALPRTANGKLDRAALPPFNPDANAGRQHVAPRTPTERAQAALWSVLLGIARPGIDDDFFDLGGDSLGAAILLAKTEQCEGRTIPMTVLFASPTIRAVAAALDAPVLDDDGAVVVLQRGGARPPLFLAHGVSGLLLRYGQLVRQLDPAQPVYGLRPPAALVASQRRLHIGTLAARYVDDILARQPTGPYHLAGFCFGGVVVMEVAHQLEARGHTVGLLALFDAEPPKAPRATRIRREATQLRALAHGDEELREYVRRRFANVVMKARRFPWAADYWLHVRTGRPLSARWNDVARVEALNAFPLQRSLQRSLGTYVAPATHCPVTMFRAGDPHAPTTAVRRVPGDTTTDESYAVDGPGVDHDTLLDEPHVVALAAVLTERLARTTTNRA